MTESTSKLKALEGLRGIAAFCVLVGHLRLTLFPDIVSQLENFITSFAPSIVAKGAKCAFLGTHDARFAVWLFWVMSAFVSCAYNCRHICI